MTPKLPLQVDSNFGSICIIDAAGDIVSYPSSLGIDRGPEVAEIAAFLCRAANAHGNLVAALREIHRIAQTEFGTDNIVTVRACRSVAETALKLSEGTQ